MQNLGISKNQTLWRGVARAIKELCNTASKISISAESREEADKLFNGLSAGGKIEFPMGDSPWGSYFGMFRDKFGIEWMVDFNPNYN